MHSYLRSVPQFVTRRISYGSIKKFSSVPAEKAAEKNTFDKHIRDLENLTTLVKKNRTKLPKREPFVKNLFLGKVDTEILTYPELKKQDVDELEIATNILQKIANQQDESNDLKEALQRMKMQKCIGLQCPLEVGGRELNHTEQCRFNEILLNNRYRYIWLNNELCMNVISNFGTDDQKINYLERLINGEIISTLSIASHSIENNLDGLKVDVTQDFDSYSLTGKQNFVLNGAIADLLIIFVQHGSGQNLAQTNGFSGYIINKNSPGVTVEELNVNEASLEGTCNFILKDVIVPKKNVLSFNNLDRNILSTVLPEYHLGNSIINLNIMKKLVNSLAEDLLKNAAPGEEIYQTEAITSVVSEILSYVYITESMLYMTSGIMSTYDNQDCDIESLITRVFSTELALKATSLGLSLVGTAAINEKHFGQQLHREALTQYISYENENMAKLTIGLLGIQHSGRNIGDSVKKLRNPMFNGNFILKKLWQNRKQSNDELDLTLELKNYFHPSCQDASDEIEYCILRLQYAVESFLGKYGIEALNYHNHLRRLSQAAMNIYAMIACLSRASRSYCVGLENNEAEIVVANVICRNFFKEVRAELNDIIQECLIMDDPLKDLSNILYNKKHYYFTHPLTRNF